MNRLILRKILAFLAQRVLKKYQPKIVAIGGSYGKTSTKEAIFQVLRNHFRVQATFANLNTDIGVPCTIIKGYDAKRNIILWLQNFSKALKLILFKDKDYPEILVLEMAADKPGDLKYLTQLFRPEISVLTGIGEPPVHLANYPSLESLLAEKAYLFKNLKPNGLTILNQDSKRIDYFKKEIKTKFLTFGFEESSQIRISDYRFHQAEYQNLDHSYISFNVSYQGNVVPFRMPVIFKSYAYAAAAAVAVGLNFNLHLVEISEALNNFCPPEHRLALKKGIKNSWLIDDSYNSSPDSLKAALEALAQFQVGRKIAVLADMLELGEETEPAHLKIGEIIFNYADVFIAIGPKMKFAFEKASEENISKKELFWFENSFEAKKMIQDFLREGDLVLLKGSHAMHLEEVLAEIIYL